MSILKKFKLGADVENQGDVLGGRSLIDAGVYPGKLKMVYLTESDGGAHGAVVELLLDNGHTHQETLWFTNREGQPYYLDKQGAKKALPGYTTLNEIAIIATGNEAEFSELDTEEKVVKVYDYLSQKEVPKEVDVLVQLLDVPMLWGITRTKEFKQQKNDDDQYVLTDEIREFNSIGKVFSEEGFTKTELFEEKEEPEFIELWKNKNTGHVIDKTVGVQPKAATKSASKPSGKNLLGKKK
jgi:hypothetical protein